MHFKSLLLLLLSVLLSSCSDSIDRPIRFFQVQTPRPFGYVIGDTIMQRIIIETRPGLALQKNSLPAKGRINRWLNLQDITIKSVAGGQGTRYQIDLVYQLFYAPLTVKMLETPSFTLQFHQFGKTIAKKVPRWHFTAAPLRELAIRKDAGKDYMRPDAPAPLIDNRAVWIRVALFLALACCLGIYLAWIYGLLRFLPRYHIFKRPVRQLAHLAESDFARMLRIMHTALNRLNGAPLFPHRLPAFYQRFPAYQQLDDELRWFFDCSNHYFFSVDSKIQPGDDAKIKALCRHCLQVERGMR